MLYVFSSRCVRMNQAEVLSLVSAIEMSLLPCLPARELQAMDRSAHPSHQGMSASLFYVRVYAMKTQSIMHAHTVSSLNVSCHLLHFGFYHQQYNIIKTLCENNAHIHFALLIPQYLHSLIGFIVLNFALSMKLMLSVT